MENKQEVITVASHIVGHIFASFNDGGMGLAKAKEESADVAIHLAKKIINKVDSYE